MLNIYNFWLFVLFVNMKQQQQLSFIPLIYFLLDSSFTKNINIYKTTKLFTNVLFIYFFLCFILSHSLTLCLFFLFLMLLFPIFNDVLQFTIVLYAIVMEWITFTLVNYWENVSLNLLIMFIIVIIIQWRSNLLQQ